MPPDPIYVDKTLFLGRVEEQKQFRAALSEVLAAPPDEDLPYILLLFGDGGMGKTTLAKRFRSIAQIEQPFEGEFQTLWVDWEDERRRYAALQVGREHISPETVFDVIHENALKQNWGRHFGAYQEMLKKRGEVEKKAAEALSAGGEHDDLAALRGISASAFAKVLRVGLPIGETGEKIAKAFLDAGIKVGAEQAAQVRAALENRLRARLDPKQFEIFLNPNDQLARALADGLKKVAASQPLIVFLDTYEIVDRADLWLRAAIRAAGPRVVWVIGGRDNLLRSGQFGNEYFKGYGDDFPRRLLAFDMRQLAEQDIRALFAERAPKRALDETAIQAISRATRGVPLALDEAAEMWAKGIALVDIVGDTDDATPRGQIVQKMTARYLLHAVAEADRQAFFALALARGDIEILRAMLRPAEASSFDLDALLQRLERDYASVHYERARLHDEPAFFLRAYLKDEIHRTADPIKTLNRRAVDVLQARLQKLEADLPRIEERCEDDDWVKAALDLTDFLFWLDEGEAWHWLIPRLVESLAYSRELGGGLWQTANNWEDCLSKGGKKRLKLLRMADNEYTSPDEHADLLDELTRLKRLGWLKGEGEDERERSAILAWQHGMLLFAREKYMESLAQYEKARRELPGRASFFRQVLAREFRYLGSEFYDSHPPNDAMKMFKYSAQLDPMNPESHDRVGDVYFYIYHNHTDAMIAYQHALELDSNYFPAHHSLGDIYCDLGLYDDAIIEYQRAIEFTPKDFFNSYSALGTVYRYLGRDDEAIATYQLGIELNPKSIALWDSLGIIYQHQHRFQEAIVAYEHLIELAPELTEVRPSLAKCYRQVGREAEANEQIRIARELVANMDEYNRACFEAICGNLDEGLALLKLALEKKQQSLEWARCDPDFDFIRDDPRFIALVGSNNHPKSETQPV